MCRGVSSKMEKGLVVPCILTPLGLLLFVGAASVGINGCPTSAQVGFVGTQTCLACHNGVSGPDKREFLDTKHGAISCEQCHGPGFAHVRVAGRGGLFINNPADQSFVMQYELCETCHESKVTGFKQMAHGALEAVSCIVCHDVHKKGGLTVQADSEALFDNSVYAKLCSDCHEGQSADFNMSGHGVMEFATCGSCHDVHKAQGLARNAINNELCIQCHGSFLLGFDTVEAVDFHTGPFMPVDPAGSGSSRCVACHLPPLDQLDQANSDHDHTLFTIPPLASNDAAALGISPIPPNSCAGIVGCHDPNVLGSGSARDVNDLFLNELLQPIYESIGADPRLGFEPAPDRPSAADLFTLISVTDPYTEWAQFPGVEGTIASAAPHGPLSQVFVNAQVEEGIANFTGRLPDGSIIVKRSFDDTMTESGDGITVMWKVSGFDPVNNDWFWTAFTFDGEVAASGEVLSCIVCHGAVRGNDFVFLHSFSK